MVSDKEQDAKYDRNVKKLQQDLAKQTAALNANKEKNAQRQAAAKKSHEKTTKQKKK